MSSVGLCPNNIYPAVVYVQIIYIQQWDDHFINIYIYISEILVKSCLLNSDIILRQLAFNGIVIMKQYVLNYVSL